MLNITITNFIKNMSKLLAYSIKSQKPFKVHSPIGNIIILSAEHYNRLIDGLHKGTNTNI